MSSVCIGTDSRNMHTHTFEQGHRECRPKASVSGQVASTGACASDFVSSRSAAGTKALGHVNLLSAPAESSVCTGSESRNMYTHTNKQGNLQRRPKAFVVSSPTSSVRMSVRESPL